MIRAEKVQPMKNYLLYVSFSDGDKRIYNCYPLLQYPIFSRLKEESFFDEPLRVPLITLPDDGKIVTCEGGDADAH